jgi:hypothetical protein
MTLVEALRLLIAILEVVAAAIEATRGSGTK